MSRQSPGRQTDISVLRILATLGVILLHTCNTLTANPESFRLTESQIHFYTACHNIMNWCVPTFMMITGILLLKQKRELTVKAVLTKYCKRALLALFLFGIPFSFLTVASSQPRQ